MAAEVILENVLPVEKRFSDLQLLIKNEICMGVISKFKRLPLQIEKWVINLMFLGCSP